MVKKVSSVIGGVTAAGFFIMMGINAAVGNPAIELAGYVSGGVCALCMAIQVVFIVKSHNVEAATNKQLRAKGRF